MARQRLIPFLETNVEQVMGRDSDPATMREAIRSAVKWIMQEIDEMNKDFPEPAPSTGPTPTVIPSFSGTVVVTTASAIEGQASLAAGTTAQRVNFPATIAGSFNFTWRTFNSNGDGVGVTILPSNIDATGFTVTNCEEACTISYRAAPLT